MKYFAVHHNSRHVLVHIASPFRVLEIVQKYFKLTVGQLVVRIVGTRLEESFTKLVTSVSDIFDKTLTLHEMLSCFNHLKHSLFAFQWEALGIVELQNSIDSKHQFYAINKPLQHLKRALNLTVCFGRFSFTASVPCPDSHPWAISNGTRCCERFHRAHDYTQNLDWYDPDSFCFESNSIPCPSNAANALCRTDKKFNGKYVSKYAFYFCLANHSEK